ncbi:MAG: DUF1326 domain-containing protein, partial [Planctomycetota bacterium]|nr:DUF1326 domain-containing protein [Planctomycetota bacterium]
GPCFANAEIGLAGKNAIMAWKIQQGSMDCGDQGDVDLAGLSVVLVTRASETLAFRGVDDPRTLKSVILVDERASSAQREALIQFARHHAGRAGKVIARIDSVAIDMKLDLLELRGELSAGKQVTLKTRKARPEDCICSNESAYYPPLASVENFVPGVTIDGQFNGRGLGTRWSTPGDRSSYMATFNY